MGLILFQQDCITTIRCGPAICRLDFYPKMSDVLKLHDVLKYSLDSPPPLPSLPFRERLRGVVKTYAAKQKRGWRTIYKREFVRVFTKDELLAHDFLNQVTFERRMNYWCGEGGDVSDAQWIFAIVKFLYAVSPATLALCFSADGYLTTGRLLAEYFASTVPSPLDRPEIVLSPAVYLARGGNQEWHLRVLDYLVITEIGEADFLKANSFRWLPHQRRLDGRGVGYYMTNRIPPLLFIKGHNDTTRFFCQCQVLPKPLLRAVNLRLDLSKYAGTLGPIHMDNVTSRSEDAYFRSSLAELSHLERHTEFPAEIADIISSVQWDF